MDRIYLDNNSTTQVHPDVIDEMMRFFDTDFGNPSSPHRNGQNARSAVDNARWALADSLGAKPDEIIFTGSGTESNNLALKGFIASLLREKKNSGPPPHIITSAIEHNSVLSVCRALEANGEASVSYIRPDRNGIVSCSSIADAFTENTSLVSIMMANNETGVIQAIEEIAKLAHNHGAAFHCDAVQGFGKIPIDAIALGVDTLSVSAHKINGPKGVGALYLRRGVRLEPLLRGGTHEKRLRAGTENVPGIVGFGVVAKLIMEHLSEIATKEKLLCDLLHDKLLANFGDTIVINGKEAGRIPNTLNVSFPGLAADALSTQLDIRGVSVSTGSACSSGTSEPSHVLKAMGLPPELLYSALRFSTGYFNTINELERALTIIVETVKEMRA